MFLHPFPYRNEIEFPLPKKEYTIKKESPIKAPRVIDYPAAPRKSEIKVHSVQEIPPFKF